MTAPRPKEDALWWEGVRWQALSKLSLGVSKRNKTPSFCVSNVLNYTF
jgi:hypothetical protein